MAVGVRECCVGTQPVANSFKPTWNPSGSLILSPEYMVHEKVPSFREIQEVVFFFKSKAITFASAAASFFRKKKSLYFPAQAFASSLIRFLVAGNAEVCRHPL